MNGGGNLALTRPHGTNGNVMFEVPVSRLHLPHGVSCKSMDFQLGWCKSLMQDLPAWKLVTGPIHGLHNLMDPSNFAYLVGITAFNGRLAFYLRLVLNFHLSIYFQRLKTAENIHMYVLKKLLCGYHFCWVPSFDKRAQFCDRKHHLQTLVTAFFPRTCLTSFHEIAFLHQVLIR